MMRINTNMNADVSTDINMNIDIGAAGMRNSHFSEAQLESLKSGKIKDAELILMLEHAQQCTFCAERLGDAVEESVMAILPPIYLKDQIREQTERLDVTVKKEMRQTSKRMQLFFYSFRVAAAVTLSILMLCVISIFPMTDMTKVEAARLERIEEKMEREEEDLAAKYYGERFPDEGCSVSEFLKENLDEAIGSLLQHKIQ